MTMNKWEEMNRTLKVFYFISLMSTVVLEDTFQDLQWLHETTDSTEHFILFLQYIHTYDKV